MARSLVESMAGDFEPEQYTDDYREALEAVIEAKVEGREIVETEEPQPNAGNVVDLMSALRASVEAAKKGRGESSPSGTAAAKKATGEEGGAKKAAKKAPAKKAAAKKAPAKKARPRRPRRRARPRRRRRARRRRRRPRRPRPARARSAGHAGSAGRPAP